MPANVQTMAFVGQMPWHGLGTRVDPDVSAQEMIRASGLDWHVVKQPARGAEPIGRRNGKDHYARYELVRKARDGTDEHDVTLGIVTHRYEPLQNVDAFSFFDAIVDRKSACFETAGALSQGERVWVMAKMPKPISVVRGDECQKYMLLSNTHTGQGSVIVKFTAVRVVCQNTLMLALDDGQQAFRVRHSKLMSARLEGIGQLIAAATKVYEVASELFVQFAKTELTSKLLGNYLDAIFPKPSMSKPKDAKPTKRQLVLNAFDGSPDLQLPGVKGTLWAAYNAVTGVEDHRSVDGESREARLDRVWFGKGATTKLKALQAARDLIAAL